MLHKLIARMSCVILFLSLSFPAFSQTEFVESLLEQSGMYLNSFEEKEELLNDVWYLYKAILNSELTVHGELETFSRSFEDAFRQVSHAVTRDNEVIELVIGQNEAREMTSAYEENQFFYQDFEQMLIDRNNYWGPEGKIARIQVRYAALAYTISPDLWRQLADFTGIWPFCRSLQ